MTRTGIAGVEYAINPYTGCAHACVYCYASFMTRFSGHTERWGTWVDAKVNIAEVLEKEIRCKSARRRKSEKLTQPSLAGLGESAKPASRESRRSPGLPESPEEPTAPDDDSFIQLGKREESLVQLLNQVAIVAVKQGPDIVRGVINFIQAEYPELFQHVPNELFIYQAVIQRICDHLTD